MELESEFTFRNTKLPQCCFKVFADMRNENKFCDIELSIGTQRVSAHRVVLAAAIPLFRETFSDEDEIPVPNIDPSVFERLIHYAYSCELKITMDNVADLLLGACILRMKDIQDACCDFLLQRLQPQNVLNFGNLAYDLNLLKLLQFVDLYVKENFEAVSRTQEFLNSSFTFVKELIGKDDLNVESEKPVLDCVLRWVKAFVYDRKVYLPELLKQVRMVLLEPLYLTEIMEREDLIRTSYVNRDLVDEAKNYCLFEERRRKCCSFATMPRQFLNISEGTPVTDTKVLCLEAEQKYTVRQLDLANKTCHTIFTQEYWENGGSVGTLNRKMYFFHNDHSFEYNLESGKCNLLPCKTVSRKFTAGVSLRNKIYVCGGRLNDFVASNAVESFDPKKNEWTQVTPLQKARWGTNAVSLGDYIYVLGGRDKNKSYDVVERHSFITGKWQYMSPMLTSRHYGGATVLNGKIYVCGGYTHLVGSVCMATAEMYDPITSKWKFVSPMNTARGMLTLLAFAGELYAVGGKDRDGKALTSCEIYDLQCDKWKHGLNVDGSLCGVIVV